MLNISDCVRLLYFVSSIYTQSPTTPHWPCKVHTHTINLYQFPNIYSQQIHQPQRHTHTTHTTTPLTPTNNHPQPHAFTPTYPTLTPTHTPTYIHYPKHPNLHPIPPQTLHYNIFKVSNLLQYTYGIAVPLQLLSTNTWTLS